MRSLIHLFKYAKIQPLAKPLGKFLTQALPRFERFDAVVPMPMHWRKRWSRGFNQAELLAAEVSRLSGIPVRRAVKRSRVGTVQAGLTNAKRRENVAGAFAPTRRRVDGLRVLLVDDVMTTGETAKACAKALKRAGAAYVSVLTVARVDRRIVAADRKDRVLQFPESTFSGSLEDAKSGSLA
ncbi:MAG: ComF family protein [Acidobacteriaceae bacterium]|nr:ComF family protein [Acidobacteriaceae bacterium]